MTSSRSFLLIIRACVMAPVLCYLAAFQSHWWLFITLMLNAIAIEGLSWHVYKSTDSVRP